MRKIREVLRYRRSTGLSLEAIARAMNISKGVVAKYLRLATEAGLAWPLPEELDDGALEKRLYQQPAARMSAFAEPDYAQVHQEPKRKGVTLILLWEEYRQQVGDGAFQYTAFCTCYRAWSYSKYMCTKRVSIACANIRRRCLAKVLQQRKRPLRKVA